MAKIKEIKETVTIPDDVTISIDEKKTVQVKGEKGTLSKTMSHPSISLQVNKNTLEISCSNYPKRKEKALIGTFCALVNNMILGVSKGYEYKMKTVYSHFPIKTAVEDNHFLIHNFLGERSPRKAEILENVTVDIKDDDIIVKGIDKEKVGQTAANIERATRVKRRDIRVFQDGVYIISKGG